MDETSASARRVLILLVGFRWLSLLPPFIILGLGWPPLPGAASILLAALLLNLAVSLFGHALNDRLQSTPALLVFEMVAMAALLAYTGGPHSVYSLFALSPLLAAAFFFHLRGALVACSVFAPMYLVAARALPGHAPFEWPEILLHIAGMFVLAARLEQGQMLAAVLA